jgi:hypothetical protein
MKSKPESSDNSSGTDNILVNLSDFSAKDFEV